MKLKSNSKFKKIKVSFFKKKKLFLPLSIFMKGGIDNESWNKVGVIFLFV